MKISESLAIEARKWAKETWLGPGKFAVLLIFSMVIIATFESMGFTNRENVIALRQLTAVKRNMCNCARDLQARESLFKAEIEVSKVKKEVHMAKISNVLLDAAISQYEFERMAPSGDQLGRWEDGKIDFEDF